MLTADAYCIAVKILSHHYMLLYTLNDLLYVVWGARLRPPEDYPIGLLVLDAFPNIWAAVSGCLGHNALLGRGAHTTKSLRMP